MADAADNKRLQTYARVAGFTYLLGMAAFMAGYEITGSMAAPGDFTQTARNVAAAEPLYRIALASLLGGAVETILVAGALYGLLKPVSANLALFALLWRVAEATFGGVVVVFRVAALENYAASTGELSEGARQALHAVLSGGYGMAFDASIAYFSVGSAIFFYLLFKSRFIPRLLSGFGVLASILAGILGFAGLLVPEQAAALGMAGWAPIASAEILTGLWLLFVGANLKYWNKRAAD